MNFIRSVAVFSFAILVFLPACKSKDKEVKQEDFLPAYSFILEQVTHIDTSMYSIKRIELRDSGNSDTSFIHRENFRAVAAEFLNLPDISSKEYAGRYKETNQFDESTNRVILSYTPVTPEKEEIQLVQILIKPDMATGDKVTTIIINKTNNTRDSSVVKRMLWQMDRSFQVSTIRQLPGQDETISTYKVVWNEDNE